MMLTKNQKIVQRDICYGDIADLGSLFEELTAGHNFDCEEAKDESLFDFIQQYIEGNDEPQPYYYYG